MMQFATPGSASTYCVSVNATTSDITMVGNFWPGSTSVPTRMQSTDHVIARAFFIKTSGPLPGGMEEKKVYYLRRNGTLIKVYSTFAEAVNQANPVTFASSQSGTLFSVYFLDYCHRYLNTWKPAEPLLTDIPCCPPVPAVNTDCPDTATVTYMGQTVAIKRNGPSSGTAIEGPIIDRIKFWQGGNISAHEIITFENPFTYTAVWHAIFAINFGYSEQESSTPYLIIRFFYKNPYDETTLYHMGTVRYKGSTSINTSKTMTFEYDGDDYVSGNNNIYSWFSVWLHLPELKYCGAVPQSIPVTFTGSTPPPPQVRVFMPDAFFPHKDTGINLGNVDEILTYDPDSLTYWGEVKTYAGIPGRIHFSIPNYYPLASTGNHFIVNSSQVFNSVPVGYLLYSLGGDFADYHLNNYSNSEIGFYESCYVEHQTPSVSWGNETWVNKFRMFVAGDAYGSYQTSLPQGQTWFDSRVVYNRNGNGPFDSTHRQTATMLIAFSKWGSARFNHQNGVRQFDSPYWSHYTRNFYAIKSVHPNAHITSLI